MRNHVIHVSPESGLVTIAGGKWTTYRAMAEETITAAVTECHLEQKNESKTDGLLLGNFRISNLLYKFQQSINYLSI